MENELEELERPSSVRRTFTLRNSAARQVAVNFMPSRQLSFNTLRLRRTTTEHNALLEDAVSAPDEVDAEKRAELIVREMEQHQRLMENNPEAEELRREALRDLPQGLTMKRNVRAKLSASVSLRSRQRPISFMKRMKYRISFAFKRLQDRFRDLTFSIELWYEAIRNIEGHFGSSVGSYFYFLRWLFALDLALCMLLLAFVIVPQTLYNSHQNTTLERSFVDLIAGKGLFEDSILFYGHYQSGDASGAGQPYYMPYAYFFTMVCLYLTFFGALCYRTAYSYRRNFIETAGGVSHLFANKVFCGWDFNIITPQAAALNAASIYNEFKELLNEQNKNSPSASYWTRVMRCSTNIAVTTLVLGTIASLEYGLWLLLDTEPSLPRWELIVSLILCSVLAVLPIIFGVIVRLEYYEPRTALYVTLARTWLLDIGTLLLLLVYWSHSNLPCWETALGQETYRLVLLDALISLFLLPLLEFCRALVYKLNPKSSPPEFNVAYNSLTIIYNQTVLWFGMIFSPLLAVAVTLKFLLLFYVKRECARRACQPARKVWRAAQTQTVFYMLVTLSLFAALFGLGSLFLRSSSHSCGPFRAYENVYSVVTEGVLGLARRPTLQRALAFLTRPGVIGSLLLALCVAVYYMRARARAQQSMVRMLRQMLLLQAKDKDFLLAAISKVSNGEWLYSPRTPTEGPDSHTWKYLQEVRKPSNAEFHFDASRLSHSLMEGRPRSLAMETRTQSYHERRSNDGDTDSSFSWQGSSNCLNQGEEAKKRWF
ncbi:unnamed protein product [Chilo suppressalis]|uniref:TMC domain-containing protein n=1 Tax=Chilo suppressalis TaxID=168631 RepID=A0ABN8ED57_CHISP|nr:unnamed protein product [Chilo suppressalis]